MWRERKGRRMLWVFWVGSASPSSSAAGGKLSVFSLLVKANLSENPESRIGDEEILSQLTWLSPFISKMRKIFWLTNYTFILVQNTIPGWTWDDGEYGRLGIIRAVSTPRGSNEGTGGDQGDACACGSERGHRAHCAGFGFYEVSLCGDEGGDIRYPLSSHVLSVHFVCIRKHSVVTPLLIRLLGWLVVTMSSHYQNPWRRKRGRRWQVFQWARDNG